MTTSKRILIYPYSDKSASAKLLKAALGAQFIKKKGSSYAPKSSDLVINWGSGWVPPYGIGTLLNSPHAVNRAVNKIKTLLTCEEGSVSVVPWTTHPNVAKEWLKQGHTVVVRHSISSSGGKGIQILTPPKTASGVPPAAALFQGIWGGFKWWKAPVASPEAQETPIEVPFALLYTQLIKKEGEFRVHVAGGAAIHTQMKLRKDGVEPNNVWNHDNGYTFTSQCEGRVDPSVLHTVRDVGIRAVKALGLDFGAADIAYSGGKGYILEVNTAPGIEEPTLSKYVSYFRSIQ